MPAVPCQVYANSPSATVSVGGTTAPSGGTVESWTVSSSATFPATELGAQQFHVQDVAAPGELFTVTNITGTTWTVVRGAESTTPVTHSAGFTVTQVVTAGDMASLQYRPWEFYVAAYGAQGDGKIIGDAVLASNTTLTSASAAFTAADTGKKIMVNGGSGTTAAPLITTLTYVNATTVTLGSAASVSGTGYSAVYGTDDTAAIAAAAAAAGTWALANSYKAQVLFGPQIYCLASGPTQFGDGSTTPTFNAQIPLPYPATNTGQKLVIELLGTGNAGEAQYWMSTSPVIQGTALVSMITAPGTPSGTYYSQSVVGGPSSAAGFSGTFANLKPHIDGITFVLPCFANQIAMDFLYCGGYSVGSAGVQAFAAPISGKSPNMAELPPLGGFQTALGIGLRAPGDGNNAESIIGSICVEGVTKGVQLQECSVATRVICVYCNYGMYIDLATGTTGVSHSINVLQYESSLNNYGIVSNGGNTVMVHLDIGLDVEGSQTDVYDSGPNMYGLVHWNTTDNRLPTITGVQRLIVINDYLYPGPWGAAPAAPATGTPQQNTAYRHATVYASAATSITNTGTGPASGSMTALGQTAGANVVIPIRVPPGHWYSVTFTGALTTKWVLE